MSKRPPLDLMALTAEQAVPMPEAVQRVTKIATPESPLPKSLTRLAKVRTEDLEPLAFKVPPDFAKRFRRRAFDADLYQNELLFEALVAWEKKEGHQELEFQLSEILTFLISIILVFLNFIFLSWTSNGEGRHS